jgi:glycosyltransferase involved in cell wall biosynthesis
VARIGFERALVSQTSKYVCAFRGRRDSYQVPLALAEAGVLDQFITDAYANPLTDACARSLPVSLRERLRSRESPGIPRELVACLWGFTVLEHLRHLLGYSPSRTFAKLDRQFSLAAAARARKTRGNLYLYTPYAWEAFTARYSHQPRKILFQFHPHPALEHCILEGDSQKYGFVQESFQEETGKFLDQDMLRRSSEPWRHADLIICASSFTRRSLLEAGAAEDRCQTIPYGVDISQATMDAPVPDRFSALFVGNGSQRKGLHHLLLGWQRALLPKNSLLTLVCRQVDTRIEAMARKTPNVRLVRGTPGRELTLLFRNSTLFVMPSLVEGFGMVYLEALAQGCPVLGTPNTGLPDIGTEADGVWQVRSGRIDELVAALELLARRLPGDDRIRASSRACATRWTWPRFRAGIRASVLF